MPRKTKTYKLIRLEESEFLVLSSIFKNSLSKIGRGTSSLPDEITQAVPKILQALESAESEEEIEDILTAKAEPAVQPKLCSQHPNYGAKRVPRTDCDVCWKAYKKFNPLSYDSARKAFKRKVNTAK